MSNFFESIPKHFTNAIKNLARHLAMTISSISAVSVTLFLMTLFLILATNVDSFADHVESSLKIHVSIDSLADDKQIEKMQEEIEKMQGVKSVEFSSKEEELNILIEESGSVFERYKDNNPMPDTFVVEVENANEIPNVTKKLNEIEGIENAQYGGSGIRDMISIFETIRYGGAVFILALAVLAVFLITNTIKMTIYTRKTEISIMRNVGAGNWYIKAPFMFEGMVIGFIGAIIPSIITIIGYQVLYNVLNGQLVSNMFVLKEPYPFTMQITAILIVSGMVVGVLGSLFATTKYLRWRR